MAFKERGKTSAEISSLTDRTDSSDPAAEKRIVHGIFRIVRLQKIERIRKEQKAMDHLI